MHWITSHTLHGSSVTSPLTPAMSERASSQISTTPCIVLKAERRHATFGMEFRSQDAPLRGMHQEMSARLSQSAHHEVHVNNHTHCPKLENVQDTASCDCLHVCRHTCMPYLCPSLAKENPVASSMYLEGLIEYNTERNLIAIILVQSLSGTVILLDAEAADNGPPSSMASISEKTSESLASSCECAGNMVPLSSLSTMSQLWCRLFGPERYVCSDASDQSLSL